MKRILLSVFIFFGVSLFAQNPSVINPEEGWYVIGLPKMTGAELEFIKGDLSSMQEITNAEFVFKDHCLLIEINPDLQSIFKYAQIENVLLKYFQKKDIYRKEGVSFKNFKSEHIKDDKFILK
jgi:hypothetical protein